jgi:hypothetical protein
MGVIHPSLAMIKYINIKNFTRQSLNFRQGKKLQNLIFLNCLLFQKYLQEALYFVE